MNFSNWLLKELSSEISIYELNLEIFRQNLRGKIPALFHPVYVDNIKSNFNWSQYPKEKFICYYENYDDSYDSETKSPGLGIKHAEFGNLLLRSKIGFYNHVIVEIGYHDPVVLVPTTLYCQRWSDFVAAATWESIVLSEDYACVMEFIRSGDYYLISNFPIEPQSTIM